MRRAHAARGGRVRGVAERRATAGATAVAPRCREPAACPARAGEPQRRAARGRAPRLQAEGFFFF